MWSNLCLTGLLLMCLLRNEFCSLTLAYEESNVFCVHILPTPSIKVIS